LPDKRGESDDENEGEVFKQPEEKNLIDTTGEL